MLLGFWLYSFSGYYFPKKWYPHVPEIGFIFVYFKFSQWYICVTCLMVLSKFMPSASYSTNRMSSAMPNTLDRLFNISSICFLTMYPVDSTPKDSQVILYLN